MPVGVFSDISWELLGRFLGRLGYVLAAPGASWSILGVSESLLKPFGGLLGVSWARLGGLLGPPGRFLGLSWGAIGSLGGALGAILEEIDQTEGSFN